MYVSLLLYKDKHKALGNKCGIHAYLVSPLSNEELIVRPFGFLVFNESFQPTPFHAKVPEKRREKSEAASARHSSSNVVGSQPLQPAFG